MGSVLFQKPKDLSGSVREDRDHGEGRDVYATLIQSNTVHPYVQTIEDTSPVGVELYKKPKDLSGSESVHMVGQKSVTSPGGVGLRKKPKDLSSSEREDRGYGEGVSTEDVGESVLCTMVCSQKTVYHL